MSLDAFQKVVISHVYREHNTMANKLSKEGLLVDEGMLFFEEFVDERGLGLDPVWFFSDDDVFG